MAHTILQRFCCLIYVCMSVVFLLQTVRTIDVECGLVTSRYIPTIINGKEVRRGAWPFIAAIIKKPDSLECGGTIISKRHVLTAAHCIELKDSSIKYHAEDLAVRLGAHNITAESEIGAEYRNVSKIHVHSDWDPFDERFDADIAILVLYVDVTFTSYIQPICLPANDAHFDDVEGYIVGWGLDDYQTVQEVPRESKTRALNDSHCYRTDYTLASKSALRIFCAGDGGGVPNKGDSGGGFFVVSHSRWVQYGIVSAMKANGTGHITPESFALLTSVKWFRDWIIKTIEWRIFDCRFEYLANIYTCRLLKIQLENDPLDLYGYGRNYHLVGKTDDDVGTILISNFTNFLQSNNIGKTFRNLKILEVDVRNNFSPELHISSRHFKHMDNLTELSLRMKSEFGVLRSEENFLRNLPNLERFLLQYSRGHILLNEATFQANLKITEVSVKSSDAESISWNLFKNNRLLENVTLHANIVDIDERTFETNEKLKKVNILAWDLRSLPWKLFNNNSLLEDVGLFCNLLKIDERTFKRNRRLRMIDIHSTQAELLPWNLFKNNLLLEKVTIRLPIAQIDERTFATNAQLKKFTLVSRAPGVFPWNVFRNNLLLENVELNVQITKIDELTFETNGGLKEVKMVLEKLDVLPWTLFNHNSLLEKVYFDFPALTVIDERMFKTNERLRSVDIDLKRLDFLSSNIFENNLLLEKVKLRLPITQIDERTFATNEQLIDVKLDLLGQIEFLPKNLFKNNLLLESVEILGRLHRIDEQTFETNVKMRRIDMRYNQLTHLDRDLFKRNLELENIDFRGNKLKRIDIDFGALKSVMSIDLTRNVCVNERFSNGTTGFSGLIAFQRNVQSKCVV